MTASNWGSGRVEVIGSDPRWSLRYPALLVFNYDESRFSALREAYEQGDSERLDGLWNNLPSSVVS